MIFEIDLDLGDLNNAIDALSIAIGERKGVLLEALGGRLYNQNSIRHAQGLGPDGKPWKPLAPSTLAAGPRKGGPLNRTGRMLNMSFSTQVDGDTLRLGFNGGDGFPAAFHQDGTRPRVNHPGLPARPLVGFPEDDRGAVIEELEDYLTTALQQRRQR